MNDLDNEIREGIENGLNEVKDDIKEILFTSKQERPGNEPDELQELNEKIQDYKELLQLAKEAGALQSTIKEYEETIKSLESQKQSLKTN